MKRKRASIVICTFLFVAIVIVSLTYMLLNPLPRDYFVFQSIEECEGLIPTDRSDVNIDQYDTPNEDEDLKDLTYHNFWGMKFKSDTLEYEIFAYEFEDADSALKYYVNVTGQNSYMKRLPLNEQDDNNLLSVSKGIFSSRIVVISQNRAYQVIAPSRYVDKIHELLTDAFSQKLP